ncbi:MAG: helix-turn-helix transcriptional regulator [Christensenellaceae bacterium]|nr:helix-turn-helix transcriptional regulator [Christensenellaceae bacterium]
MKTIYELNITLGDDDELPDSVDLMLACHSASEIYCEANRIMAKLCNQIKKNGAPQNFLSETQIFIQKNYSNPNLSITMIADYFNLTPSYLSKKFKSLTGGGLLDYINQVRIDKAKHMLSNTKASIGCIAKACGFISSNNFIRVFKKYEGITPRMYRDASSLNSKVLPLSGSSQAREDSRTYYAPKKEVEVGKA